MNAGVCDPPLVRIGDYKVFGIVKPQIEGGYAMKHFVLFAGLLIFVCVEMIQAQNIHQQYSGKIGFYNPDKGLNNGLMIGADGITEFLHYDFFLNLSADLYFKQSFNFYNDPKPDIVQHQVILIPIGAGGAYKLLDVADADSRIYLGAGIGYYLYFYSVEYSTSTGGILGGVTTESASKTGGNLFFTFILRALVGKVFVEPRFFVASQKDDMVGPHRYTLNPSGFSISLGFQY